MAQSCCNISTSSGRRALRCMWWLIATAVLVTVPIIFWVWMRNGYKYELLAWIISGIFVLLAVPMTVYQVAMHYENYTKPHYQRRIIRILWMVPIYGLCSWFSLRFKDAEVYLDTAREFYEAFVIYNFYMFLIVFLEETFGPSSGDGTGSLPQYLEETRVEVPHIWPLNHMFPPVRRPENAKEHPFFRKCKNGVMAYVIWRPLSATIAFWASSKDLFFSEHHPLRPDRFYVWLALSNSTTQCWAMYCLIWLYVTMHDELEQTRPMLKFICVKAVVFMSFWQSIVIMVLVQLDILTPSDLAPHRDPGEQPTKAELATALNNVLICLEMFLAALAHANAFPAKEYYPPEPLTPTARRGLVRNIWDMFNLWDVFQDTRDFGGDMVVLGGTAIRDTAGTLLPMGGRAVMTGMQGMTRNVPVLKHFNWSRDPNRGGTPLLAEDEGGPSAFSGEASGMQGRPAYQVYETLGAERSSPTPSGRDHKE
mmetsp:Transcript_35446/g.89373  ORF Transcript_35446/g.89373 Transcript_35446/m.89373 type:complete len:480 (-) Transcript_35446:173-1612(-)